MRRWVAAGAWAVVVACSAPQPGEPVMLGSPPPAESTAASSSPVVAASISASASAAPAVASGVPRLPVRASPPGAIQCETVDCDLATQICCVGRDEGSEMVGKCLPKPSEPHLFGAAPKACCAGGQGFCNGEAELLHTCDEASDCGPGKRCCAMTGGEGDVSRRYCSADCSAETCLAGSTCPNGNACTSAPGELSGECSLQLKPPRCGDTTCKTGESCCWSAETQSGRCAEKCNGPAEGTYQCTSGDQCEKGHLCEQKLSSSGPYRCGGDWFTFGVLCNTLKDCPKHLSAYGLGPQAEQARKCATSKLLPKGVKACVYE